MTMKRTSLIMDEHDLRKLERIAKDEAQRTGSRMSASAIARRLVREFLQSKSGKR